MIVPMSKIYLVARPCDRESLLNALRELGVLHLVPVDPARAVADDQAAQQVQAVQRALQVLAGVSPGKPTSGLTPVDAAHEVLEIERRAAEGRNHLATLDHQLEQIAMWGNLQLKQFEQLRQAGVHVQFCQMPARSVGAVKAECVEVVADLPGRQVLVAVADRTGEAKLPDEATPVPLPPRDAPSIRAEAKQVDASLHADTQRLHELAGLVPQLQAELARLEREMDYTVATRGAADDPDLFVLQGWLPADTAATLGEQLAGRDIPVAVEYSEPAPDEQPPTLVRPPAWARPIEGLFGMLGTIPGYREFDVSVPFLIALPIFTAMLISDAGYGALLLIGPLLAYRRVSKIVGARFTQLLMIVGGVSLIWGVITNAYFGAPLPFYRPLISIDLSKESRLFMMWLSFTLGAVHLTFAQLWQAIRYFPDLRFLNKLGWAVFIWGMYGVVNMFVLKGPMDWQTPWPYLLLAGAALAVLFASPSRNPAKMIALGLADFPLSMLSAFSDIISYVRLMAVGLASSVLAVSFNEMALNIDFWPLVVLVMVFGHSLNLGLAMIAMFAHGVRLNMLEFSNNLGMQWIGYPYHPFTQSVIQEHMP